MIVTSKTHCALNDLCREHNDKTYNDVQVGDVIYSYCKFEENGFDWDKFHVTNDWDEGKNNDPFWDEDLNMHSAESFILRTCKKIKNGEI